MLAIATAYAAVQIAASAFGPYGHFIDEFYYLACAKRLAWGYVDHPPLSIAILAATRALLGTSATAIRLPAILAVSAAIVLASVIARRLGGGRFAQILAASCVASSPIALVIGSFYSMNALELLLWPLVAIQVIEIIDRDDPRRWLWVFAILGVGLENKHTMILLVAGVGLGVLLTPLRTHLRTRWPWLGAALALALIAPNIVWQAANGYPSIEFYRNAQALKNVPTPPLSAIGQQMQLAGPGALPVWLAGGAWLLGSEAARRYRVFGWAFLALFAIMILSGSSRPDRIAAIYPVIFAAGAVAVETYAVDRRRALRYAAMGFTLAGGALLAPLAVALLPPGAVAAYAQKLGVVPRIERGKTSPLPQWLADRIEWDRFVEDVAQVYRSLSAEDRARSVIYCPSYGQAGAVELLGARYDLPRVISGHNNYWHWSAEVSRADVLIAVDAKPRDLDRLFEQHELVTVHRCAYCMSWRDGAPIFVARRPRVPLAEAWPDEKHYE